MKNRIGILKLKFTESNECLLMTIIFNEQDKLNLPTVTAFINGDVQSSERGEYILKIIENVINKKNNYDEYKGNGCTLEIRKDKVKVINNFLEDDISEIATEELIRILRIWIENKKKFDKSFEKERGEAKEIIKVYDEEYEEKINEIGVYEKKYKEEKKGIKVNCIKDCFPDNLSKQKIVDLINEAYSNKIKVYETKNMYIGISNTGMHIFMYLNEEGKIENAFPMYEKYPMPKENEIKYKYFEFKEYSREGEVEGVDIFFPKEYNLSFISGFLSYAVRDTEDEELWLKDIREVETGTEEKLETFHNELGLEIDSNNKDYISVICYIIEEMAEGEIQKEEYSSTIEVEYFKKFMRLQVELREKFNETGDIY